MDNGEQRTIRMAVLIDADNTQPAVVAPLLAEIAKYGTAMPNAPPASASCVQRWPAPPSPNTSPC
ncbi:hypothetical protein C5N14_28360 [Micromonospora sp. MW-13]|uniref:hypothetical protein n=1 Tax=Micromonospora sp. MW-13 TaxID=2094022 RepID=UPI000E44EB08|nr:hypothetical protein [Micromonospora sp. MW-13]RGC65520.1 hypothetical protein C5N14_28360 [Micromonospora sp. MW-13]